MKFDIHVHTNISKCSNIKLEDLIKKIKKLSFDFVFITDHNTIFKSRYECLLPGIEIKSAEGDILGLYVNEGIKKDLGVEETIELIHEQGGLAIAPHPWDIFRQGVRNFNNYKFDAIEVLNSRPVIPFSNLITQKLAKKQVCLAGSDSHFIQEFGRAYNLSELDDPFKAIKHNKVSWSGTAAFLLPHIRTKVYKLTKGLF